VGVLRLQGGVIFLEEIDDVLLFRFDHFGLFALPVEADVAFSGLTCM